MIARYSDFASSLRHHGYGRVYSAQPVYLNHGEWFQSTRLNFRLAPLSLLPQIHLNSAKLRHVVFPYGFLLFIT